MPDKTMEPPEPQLQTKPLRRALSDNDLQLYRAALEWDLIDPIVIESRKDLKSEPRWQQHLIITVAMTSVFMLYALYWLLKSETKYAFVASLTLELAGMAAMMRADVAPEADAPAELAMEIEQPSNVVALIQPPQKRGTVEKFMLACVGRAKGSRVSWGELYVRYRRWCAEEGFSALSADMFGKRLDSLRAESVLRTRAKGEDVYCLDVKLVA